jgi:hypothetical protein
MTRKVRFQLYDQGAGMMAGSIVSGTGGVVYVATAGDAAKRATRTALLSATLGPSRPVGASSTSPMP